MDINSLRKIGDSLKTKIKSGIIILGSANENKANLVVMVTSDISAKLQADKIIKEFVFMLGGSGGGKPELAQAGCKDILKLDVALNSATEIIKKFCIEKI